jgi:hypothetical protein
MCGLFYFRLWTWISTLFFDKGNALEFEFVSEGTEGMIVQMLTYSTTEIPGDLLYRKTNAR